MKDITLKEIDITEKPDFDIRGFWLTYLNKDATIRVIDWMATASYAKTPGEIL